MPETHELTPKQYAKQERRKIYEQNRAEGITFREVLEYCPDSHFNGDHEAAVIAAVKTNVPLSRVVLDALPEAFVLLRLMHDYPASTSFPKGYLVPSIRAFNEKHEREMIAARKAGRTAE